MRNPTALLLLLLVLHMLSSFSFCLGLFPLKLSFSRARQMHYSHHSHRPSTAPSPAPQPNRHAFPPTPSKHPSARRRGHQRHHHRHHHHWYVGPSVTASPPSGQDCHQICEEPLTSTPFGSPCGCVFPMKVRILLNVAPVSIFPMTNELEFEVAAGTYLEQSQVRIMGANADSQNQGRTVVDFDLVPLGEKFDNTTAVLIYERLLHKKVLLNSSLFGDYDVVYVSYPGISSSPQNGDITGNAPSGSAGVVPFSVNIGDKNSGMNFRTIAIIAVSAFVVIFVLIGAGCVLVKWSKFGKPPDAVGPGFASSIKKRSGRESIFSSSIRSSGSLSPMSSMPTSVLSVKTFTLPELEKATDKFSSNRILGEGGFGRVYRATMEDGTEAAVKLLTRNKQNRDREFIAEIDMLSRLHHRNLVKLLGICIEGHTRCMVYELVHNGSLESHLHGIDNKNGAMDWDARLKISLGAARGLAYLHEDSNPRVIHRDFKASNVLLEDDFTPKVSDFGLAREATEGSQHISTRVMGTFGYVAPEYAMTGHLLVKSDVYSYGVVLLELLTRRKPVDMSQPQGQENLVTWARPLLTTREGLAQLVDPSLSGTYNFDDMAKVASIASMCVHPEVTHRPFMGEVVQALKLVYNDMDETCGDYLSQKDSSPDSDFKADFAHSETSWWNATPRLNHGKSSSFVTMDYSSGPLEEGENRASSASSLAGEGMMALANRSGPLRTTRSKRSFFRMRGSLSEHGGMFSRRFWNNGGWV